MSGRRLLACLLLSGALAAGCGGSPRSSQSVPSNSPAPGSSAPASRSAAASPAPSPSALACPTLTTHVVLAGESLADIAARYGVTSEALAAVNPQIGDTHPIAAGDRLVIAPLVLEAPGGWRSSAEDINERGDVAGAISSGVGAAQIDHAALWRDGVLRDLGTLGGLSASAVAIDDRGQLVGSMKTPDGGSRGFLWQDGVVADLGPLVPRDINDAGQILGSVPAGASSEGIPQWRTVVWEKGVTTDLGPPGGSSIRANAINGRGQVVGTMAVEPGRYGRWHAFLWDGGIMTDLTPGLMGWSEAHAITDTGEVVGSTSPYREGGPRQPVVWHDGTATDLPAPGGDAEAWGINDRGQVVGFAWTGRSNDPSGADGLAHGYLWQDGMATDLGTLAGTDMRSWATTINGCGEVLGYGDTGQGEATRPLIWQVGPIAAASPWATSSPQSFVTSTARWSPPRRGRADLRPAAAVVGTPVGVEPDDGHIALWTPEEWQCRAPAADGWPGFADVQAVDSCRVDLAVTSMPPLG